MARQPKPSRTFRSIVKATEEEQRKQRSTSPFFGTGMHPTGSGGMAVDGTMTVGGQLNVTGDTVIGGTLSLPAGIIGNDALTSPVKGDYAYADATSFSLSSTAYVKLASVSRTVPAGFTQMVATLSGGLYAINPNTTGGSNGTGGDAWVCYVSSSPGYGSRVYPSGVSGSNGFASVHAHVSYTLTVTPGSSIEFQLWGASTYANVSANASNVCDVSATVTWLR